MSNLEEGILRYWSLGQVVLAGDACHKRTPNGGLGFNNGIQDVVVLCYHLQEADSAAPGGQPIIDALTRIYQIYKEASSNSFYFIASRYLAPPDLWTH
ncbi:hypothetical protein BBP40_003510 [Aspergillus hancockii]|nr:hypothetical protein BBP40_003510 [Aspergillus hancockii]